MSATSCEIIEDEYCSNDKLLCNLEDKLSKYKFFMRLKKTKKKSYETGMFFLLGMLCSQTFGHELGIGAILFGSCLIKHKIYNYNKFLIWFLVTFEVLAVFEIVSLRTVGLCDVSIIIYEHYFNKKHKLTLKEQLNTKTVCKTFTTLSLLNPSNINNFVLILKNVYVYTNILERMFCFLDNTFGIKKHLKLLKEKFE